MVLPFVQVGMPQNPMVNLPLANKSAVHIFFTKRDRSIDQIQKGQRQDSL